MRLLPVVEGPKGTVYVALRDAAAVATIDVAKERVIARRDACPEPRGLAWDHGGEDTEGVLYVVCETGELVALPQGASAPSRRISLEPDLRDVLVDGDRLLVSRLKSAELLEVDLDKGEIVSRRTPPQVEQPRPLGDESESKTEMIPAVAWRPVKGPRGIPARRAPRAVHARRLCRDPARAVRSRVRGLVTRKHRQPERVRNRRRGRVPPVVVTRGGGSPAATRPPPARAA